MFFILSCFLLMRQHPPRATQTDTPFPYATLFRSRRAAKVGAPPIMAGGASRHFESFHLSERLDCCWRSGWTGLEGFGGSAIGRAVAFRIGPDRRRATGAYA